MAGKQAKVLSNANINDLLLLAQTTRRPVRNKVIVLLSTKAGLRACEIAQLTWEMVPPAPLVRRFNYRIMQPKKAVAERCRCTTTCGGH